MGTQLRAGARLKSGVCATEVIVVRAPAGDADLWCGGHPMVALDAPLPGRATLDPAHAQGTALGKRYADEALGLEVLCTKGGDGSLSLAGEPLLVKEAKPLPSSD